MQFLVRLITPSSAAKLFVNDNEIADLNGVYCYNPVHISGTNTATLDFRIRTSEASKADAIKFGVRAAYTEALTNTENPAEEGHKKYYESNEEFQEFLVIPNHYECCNYKPITPDLKTPKIIKHNNSENDIELYLPNIDESYIIEPDVPEYIDAVVTFDSANNCLWLKLDGARYKYNNVPTSWQDNDAITTVANGVLVDSNGNPIENTTLNANGSVHTVVNAYNPAIYNNTHYEEFLYEDTENPARITTYINHAGALSRTINYTYDEYGNLKGKSTNLGSSCSCGGSNDSFYSYDSNGNLATEEDAYGNIRYEYEYDESNRLIAKYLRSKNDSCPITAITYFDGYQDELNYINDDLDYEFKRIFTDEHDNAIRKYEFEILNIGSTYADSIDPNNPGAGVFITNYRNTYNGDYLISRETLGPRYNLGEVNSYTKDCYLWPETNEESTVLITDNVDGYTTIRDGEYETYVGSSNRSQLKSYSAFGTYTEYTYDPQTGAVLTELTPSGKRTTYTYNPNGTVNTIVVEDTEDVSSAVTTYYLYDELGFDAGTIVCDYSDNILYETTVICNGFGEPLITVDRAGVARGKKYDDYGRVVSDFTLLMPALYSAPNNNDPNQVEYFDNANFDPLYDAPDEIYANLTVTSQTAYAYDPNGLKYETSIAVDDGPFLYGNPDSWKTSRTLYDSQGRVYQKIENYGVENLTTTYLYDRQGRAYKTINPDGSWTETAYDGRGLATMRVTGYDDLNGTPQNVIVNETIYDADGNILKEIEGSTVVRSYLRDALGRAKRVYDGDFETSSCNYTESYFDIAGNTILERTVENTDPNLILSESHYEYDSSGRQILSRRLADPALGESDSSDRISITSYDYMDRPVETLRKAAGNSNIDLDSYNWRQSGDIVEQRWYSASGEVLYRAQFEYDGGTELPFDDTSDLLAYAVEHQDVYIEKYEYQNAILQKTYILAGYDGTAPDGVLWLKTSMNDYNGQGQVEKVTDALGNYRTTYYNSLGAPVEQIQWQAYEPDGTPLTTALPLSKRVTEYSPVGRVSKQIVFKDAQGSLYNASDDSVIDYAYNAHGKLDHTTTYYYDGTVLSSAVTYQQYDEIGRPLQTTQPDGSYIFNHYQSATGRNLKDYTVKHENDPDNSANSYDITTFYEYDSAGRVFKEILDVNGDGVKEEDIDRITLYDYDAAGRKSEITAPDGVITKYDYTPFGELESKTEDYNGSLERVTNYQHSRDGRLSSVGYDDGLVNETTYSYDALGNVETIAYPDGTAIEYAYNSLSKPTEMVTRGGVTLYYDYDLLGRCISESGAYSDDPNLTGTYISTYSYDAAGNMLTAAKTDTCGFLSDSEFTYNGFGLRESESIIVNSSDEIEITYDYDQSGHMVSRTVDGKTTYYDYLSTGKVAGIDDGTNTLASFTYVGSNRSSVDYSSASGLYLDYDYYPTGETHTMDYNQGTYEYTYDSAGRIMTRKIGSQWDYFQYDSLGRITDGQYGLLSNPLAIAQPTGLEAVMYAGLDWAENENSFDVSKLVSPAKTIAATYPHSENEPLMSLTELYDPNSIGFASPLGFTTTMLMLSSPLSTGEDAYSYDSYGNRTSALFIDGHTENYEADIPTESNPTDSSRYINAGPVAHWKFNTDPNSQEATETFDSAGVNNLTIHGSPTFGTGVFGNAMTLSTDNDYAEAVGYYGISGTQPRTISTWYKSNAVLGTTIAIWGEDGVDGARWQFGTNGVSVAGTIGAPRMYLHNGKITGETNINDGIWHHVAVVLPEYGSRADDILLYVDGELETPSYVDSSLAIDTGSTEEVMIGNSFYGNNHLYGSLDDLRIYEKPLDGDQIAELAALDSESEIQYNTDGAMEYDGTNRYTYNSDGSLASVDNGEFVPSYMYNAAVYSYKYDALGRRVLRESDSGDSVLYLYDSSDRCIAEYTSADDCDTLAYSAGYVYADTDGLGAPVAVEDAAGSYQYVATDPQGNVIYQAHSSSYIVLIKYDAYGNVYNTSAGDLNLPFRFAGMRYEKDADIYLTPNRAYSPTIGRWLQPDPLGTLPNPKQGNRFNPLDQYTDGQNLYEYCAGDPVNERDLLGLVDDEDIFWGIYDQWTTGEGTTFRPPWSNYFKNYSHGDINFRSQAISSLKDSAESLFLNPSRKGRYSTGHKSMLINRSGWVLYTLNGVKYSISGEWERVNKCTLRMTANEHKVEDIADVNGSKDFIILVASIAMNAFNTGNPGLPFELICEWKVDEYIFRDKGRGKIAPDKNAWPFVK
jgi:RHS repeat-associated protein